MVKVNDLPLKRQALVKRKGSGKNAPAIAAIHHLAEARMRSGCRGVKLQVTQKELDAMENLAVAWDLCDKHKGILNASEEDNFRFTQKCKKCIKISKEIRVKTLHLWSKLVTAYLKATRKGRKEPK